MRHLDNSGDPKSTKVERLDCQTIVTENTSQLHLVVKRRATRLIIGPR